MTTKCLKMVSVPLLFLEPSARFSRLACGTCGKTDVKKETFAPKDASKIIRIHVLHCHEYH